jgi:hypothetical protein
MALEFGQITIDCGVANTLAGFWSQLVDAPIDDGATEFFATVGRAAGRVPVLMFIKVPEAKQHKNRVHLDLTGADWTSEVERVVGLGAVRVSEHQEFGTHWVTMRDPEGNEFDIGAGMG